ncbi:MAG: sulfotransferase, partial [Myxococcota bacterium]
AAMISMRSGAVDRNLCTRLQSAASPMLLGKFMEQRARGDLPEDRISDIRYPDLVSNPIGTVASLYRRLGRNFSADARDRMKTWLDAKASEPPVPHQHRFEDTGLDLATERAKYRDYMKRFDLPEEI